MRTRKTLALAVILVAPLCAVLTSIAIPKLFGMALLFLAPIFSGFSGLSILVIFLLISAIARLNLSDNRDIIPF